MIGPCADSLINSIASHSDTFLIEINSNLIGQFQKAQMLTGSNINEQDFFELILKTTFGTAQCPAGERGLNHFPDGLNVVIVEFPANRRSHGNCEKSHVTRIPKQRF